MVKVVLEENDIIELIKAKYPSAEIISGISKEIEVVIRVTDITPAITKNSVDVHAVIPPKVVRDTNGAIDAVKSGLTSTPRKKTNPGKDMGRERGRLPVF